MQYYIYDLERKMFWKKNKFGYTMNLSDALSTNNKDDALKYMKDDVGKNTLALTEDVVKNLITDK